MHATAVSYRLSDSGFFSTRDRRVRKRLDCIGTQVRRPAGTVLAHEGTRVRQVIVIVEGIATACHADGVERITAGGTIGAREIVLGRAHTATIVAETPVVLEVLGLGEFSALATGERARWLPRWIRGRVRVMR